MHRADSRSPKLIVSYTPFQNIANSARATNGSAARLMAAGQRLPPAATQRCAVLPFSVAKATGVRLHPAHTPCRWHEHQFSSEWWMDRWMAEKVSPPDGRDPDLVYLTDHSFSLWCHRQQAVVKDHLVSAEPETRLKAPAPRILLYLPNISPTSPPYRPDISPTSPTYLPVSPPQAARP